MTDIDNVMAGLLSGAQAKFGKSAVYVAEEHDRQICGFPCPMVWGWFIGGADVVPCTRVIGCDGKSGTFKSTLMLEHCVWCIQAGGVAVIIDTEEKTSDTLVRSLLYRLPPELRSRLIYNKATSLEEAEQMITYYRKQAEEFKSFAPDQRVPLFVVWDSLTGADTEGKQKGVAKEGNAQVRSYPEQAMAISAYYKSMQFDNQLITVAHVQHAKKNNDPNAMGDEAWIPNGGDEPRFKSTYHFRTLYAKDIDCADWVGKQVKIKNIKSSLGTNHRTLEVRICWRNVWIDKPLIEQGKNGPKFTPSNTMMSPADAKQYWQEAQQCLYPGEAAALAEFLKLGSDKEVARPITERIRWQQTWFDWDWALGNLLVHQIKYNDDVYAKEKRDLDETLRFVKGNDNEVKCEELFGDKEFRTLQEFGAAVVANQDVADRIRRFLAITHYQSFREIDLGASSKKAKKSKEAKGE